MERRVFKTLHFRLLKRPGGRCRRLRLSRNAELSFGTIGNGSAASDLPPEGPKKKSWAELAHISPKVSFRTIENGSAACDLPPEGPKKSVGLIWRISRIWRISKDSRLRTQNSELRTQDSELRTQNSGLRTQNSGRRTQDLGLRIQNSELRHVRLFT